MYSNNYYFFNVFKELEMRRDTLSFAMDVAAAKWRAAKSENELIYHEIVVPVLSDDDDSDCMGTLSSTNSNRRLLDRVKGASLVKPIGFSVDDPELLTVIVANNSESSSANTTTTLFKDLVPSVTRHQVAIYRLVLYLSINKLLMLLLLYKVVGSTIFISSFTPKSLTKLLI